MSDLEDDLVIGRFFDTPEKKAKWIYRFKIAIIFWIVFVIIGISFLIWYSLR